MRETYPRNTPVPPDAQVREPAASAGQTPHPGQYPEAYVAPHAGPYGEVYANRSANAYAGAYSGATNHPRTGAHAAPTLHVAWVVVCACLLAAFTAFVLLDTFAIARVGQAVQEADLSSIVAARGNAGADEASGSSASSESSEDGQGTGDGDDTGGNASGDENIAAGAAPTDKPDASDDSNAEDSNNGDTAAHGSGRHHGRHGGSGMKPGSSDAAQDTGQSDNTDDADDTSLEVGSGSASTAGTTVGTYSDENMAITVSRLRAYDTDIYVADIQVSSAEYLKTALAQNAYGRNLKDTTSNMADAAGAVLAINGDYYGFRDVGYVVRNGVLYRDTADAGTDALVVYGDGTMASASQDGTTAEQLVDSGAWQVLSFGPTLLEDGQFSVSAGDEVDKAMGSNPRTAIGMVDALHYIVVVSDGRTGDNDGLSLYQLAQVMLDNGATYAYNLDGGGSTTLWFKGEVLNSPSSGNRSGEREVSDIVYFG